MLRARGAGPHRAQDVTPSDPRPRRLGPAQLLDLPGPLPPLWAMRLPPAHHSSFQAEGHGLHLPLRALRAPVADRHHRRDGGTHRREPTGRGSCDRSRAGDHRHRPGRVEPQEAASALRDRDDGFERPDPAEDPGRGAGQGHGRRSEVPGPTLGGATPAGPDSSGGHGIGLPGGLRRAAEAQPRRDRPVPRGQEVQRGRRCPTKKLTREYKATLTKAERKAFRAEMWAFRRDPESLTPEEQRALGGLFLKIPKLKELYRVRLRFKEIFGTAPNRTTAARWLRELRRETEQLGLDLGPYFSTYDRWKTEILNYFDARQTSAAVEGVNNKARVITKRAYGLKSADSLWNRLILDLNRVSEAIGWSIEQIRQMARGLKALFDPACT